MLYFQVFPSRTPHQFSALSRRHVQLAPAFPRVGVGRLVYAGGYIFATVSEGEKEEGREGLFRVDYPSLACHRLSSFHRFADLCRNIFLHHPAFIYLPPDPLISVACSPPGVLLVQSNRPPPILLCHVRERKRDACPPVAINTRMSAQESAE